MTDYRRNFVAGGSFFFTVNLEDRGLTLLTDHIDVLRRAVRETRISSILDRCDRDLARTPACNLDPTGRRLRLRNALAANQIDVLARSAWRGADFSQSR